EELVGKFPDAPHYQGDLARTYNGLGLLYLDGKKAAAAGEVFRKALALWEALAAAHPDDPEFAVGLATCRYNLGNQSQADGRHEAAADWYTRALQSLE